MSRQTHSVKHPKLGAPEYINCSLSGDVLLNDATFNKGSAFPADERKAFGLLGRLPIKVQTLEEQVERAYAQYSSRPNDLAKNTFMNSMQDQNSVLYYRLILDHLKEMFSVIYTPTEGAAIQQYSHLFRRPDGCFLSIDDIDGVEDALKGWAKSEDIDLIVVSDGEQILGIGDQGVGGILISIAKLVVYTLCAGINPRRTLPVILDCGTNNEGLLNDELYLGIPKRRVRGERYDKFFNTFVQAARKHYPNAYIHCEDFGFANARRILDEYRPKIPLFNDDVQGTGCVTLAAVRAGLHVSNVPLKDARIICFGAGTAGIGIADQLSKAIAMEANISLEEARRQIWAVDKSGLLLESQKNDLSEPQLAYARDDKEWNAGDPTKLHDIVKDVKSHVLIGTSTQPKAFTEDVIAEMASHVERPIVLPLSNPTRLHEASPQDINAWSNGKALIATGSPFPPVEHDGIKYEVAECNNSTIFPGIGLGTILSRARLITDKMLVAATEALAQQSPALEDPNKGLLPDVGNVREISVAIAKAVVRQAQEDGVNQETHIPSDDTEFDSWVRTAMWNPVYLPLKAVE